MCHSVYIAMEAVPRKSFVYCKDDAVHSLFVKRARGCKEGIVNSKQLSVTAQVEMARVADRVLLRCVYFLNVERTPYVSVGSYPSDNYQFYVELGGPLIVPLRLTEHHFRTLMEALPALCDAMQCGETYTRKDVAFRIRSGRTHNCAKLYHGKQ